MSGMRPPSMDMMGPPSSYYPPSHSTYPGYPPSVNVNVPMAPISGSLALFNIPSDASNSLYVDGIPNDTHEREVSRMLRPSLRYLPALPRL